MLIEKGALINQKELRDRTPLMCAAANGNTTTVRFLLSKGALSHAEAANGWLAAHFSAANGHAETLSILLDQDGAANVCGVRGVDGLGPLELAKSGLASCEDDTLSSTTPEMRRTVANYKKVISILENVVPIGATAPEALIRRGSMRRASTVQMMAQNALTYARRFSAWGVHRLQMEGQQQQQTSVSGEGGRRRGAPPMTDAVRRSTRANTPSPVAQREMLDPLDDVVDELPAPVAPVA